MSFCDISRSIFRLFLQITRSRSHLLLIFRGVFSPYPPIVSPQDFEPLPLQQISLPSCDTETRYGDRLTNVSRRTWLDGPSRPSSSRLNLFRCYICTAHSVLFREMYQPWFQLVFKFCNIHSRLLAPALFLSLLVWQPRW
jgi:hypothetical protein